MKKRITFKKLLRHHCLYSDEEQFEIFRWMLQTGWEHRDKGRWGDSGVFEWLYGLSSTGSQNYWFDYGFSSVRTWRTELTLSFLRAIIDDDPPQSVLDWRKEQRISPDSVRYLDLNISEEPGDRCSENLYQLFTNNKKLTTQLNPCWKQAVNINNVILTTNGTNWLVNLVYGFDSSSWTEQISYGDQFLKVLRVAAERLTELTT